MPLIVEKLREIQRNSDFWTECPKVQNLQLNMEPLTSGHCVQKQKEFCCVFSYISKLFLFEKIKRKNEGKSSARQRTRIFLRKTRRIIKMSFFTTAVTGLKTVVTVIGAGVGVWGVINLLEGYGNDNPGANAHVR